MHAVAINGSPQARGSTKVLLECVLAPLNESGWTTEVVQLGGRNLNPCGGCTACFKYANARCAHNSDDFNAIYSRMLSSEAVILGSPAGFNADLVPEVNNFINRSAYLSAANKASLAGKVGAAVIDVPKGSFIEAYDKVNRFFLRSKMIVPGISGWGTGAKGLHKHRKVSDIETLKEMRRIGEMVDWLARAVQPCLKDLPEERGEAAAAVPMVIEEKALVPLETTETQTSALVEWRRTNLPMPRPDKYSELAGR